MDDRERRIRKRLRDDFPYYAKKCLKIRTKQGGLDEFILNRPQLYLHGRIQDQLDRLGRVRILVPKSRQTGVTSYTQGRFLHKVSHRKGVQAFILSHHSDSTAAIFKMAGRFYDNLPNLIKPQRDISNARELVFGLLNSGYRTATAGSKDVGRGQTIQYLHGSECAYWDSAETHFAGLLQAIPNAPGSEIILESTSAGREGKFYEMCMAAQHGDGDYEVVFLPWHWMNEYADPAPDDFEITAAEISLKNHVKSLYDDTITNDQLLWRRKKIFELGASAFKREYPIDIEECFAADAEGALWERDIINQHRRRPDQVPPLRELAVGLDPSITAKTTSDEAGIILVGLGQDDHLYIFSDRSGRMHPRDWGYAAVQLCRTGFNGRPGDYIVGEINQGGLMVQETVFHVDENIGFKGVHEHDGKRVRAEPVALYYKQGLVHHVGLDLEKLEDEMTSWAARTNDESPNRVDALVLACKTLKPHQTTTGMLRYMEQQFNEMQKAKAL